jgi:hypothetical protein
MRIKDGLVAGSWAAVLGAIPSTVYGLATGQVSETTLAAGSILLPKERRRSTLGLAAVPVHLGLSFGWGVIASLILPRRSTSAWGVALGAAIAALDLGVIGRRFPRIQALPPVPQIADHLAYGLVVGLVLKRRRINIAGDG